MMYLGKDPVGLISGNKFEYEEGFYIPDADIIAPTINFNNTHSTLPLAVILTDTTVASNPVNTLLSWNLSHYSGLSNTLDQFLSANNSAYTTSISALYTTSNSVSLTVFVTLEPPPNSRTDINEYLRLSSFTPQVTSSQFYLRANHIYRWFAVWDANKEVTSSANE